MRYCYAIPAGITSTVHGTGAALQTDDRLTNGQPSEVTVLSWLSDGSPSTAHYVDLRQAWPAARQIRTLALHGLSCGAGVLIEATGRREADAGYTYDLDHVTQRTVALPDGRVDWIVELADSLDPLIGVQFRIYNDRSGVTWATAATDLSIGECRPWRGVTLFGEAGWRRGRRDPTEYADTLAGGEHAAQRAAWRTLQIGLVADNLADVRAGGLEDSQDWETLEAASKGASRCLVIVRREDAAEIHRTALFGRPSFEPIGNVAGPVYRANLQVREVR